MGQTLFWNQLLENSCWTVSIRNHLFLLYKYKLNKTAAMKQIFVLQYVSLTYSKHMIVRTNGNENCYENKITEVIKLMLDVKRL